MLSMLESSAPALSSPDVVPESFVVDFIGQFLFLA